VVDVVVDVVVVDVDVVEGDPLEPCPDEDAGAVVVVEEVEVVVAGAGWPVGGPPDTGPPDTGPEVDPSPAPLVGSAPGRPPPLPPGAETRTPAPGAFEELEVVVLVPVAPRASEVVRPDDSPRTAGGDSECTRPGRPKVGSPIAPSLGSRAKPAASRAR
jgi:hypothetical protein